MQRHEAAHLLTGYLLGFPVASYSLMLGAHSGSRPCRGPILPSPDKHARSGKEHTEFAEGKSQRKLYGRNFSEQEVNEFSVLAMAGAASEAMKYDEARTS